MTTFITTDTYNKCFYYKLFSRKQEVQLTSNLFAVLGSKPNLNVHLDTLKWYTETKSMALIYIEEKLQNGMLNI